MELLDEHEQSERVRQWLHQNGAAIVGGVVLGLVLIVGYQWWHKSQLDHRLTAATQFAAAESAAERKDGDAFDALAQELQSKFADTPYAGFALMQKADREFEAGQADKAVDSLKAASAALDDPSLRGLILLREARVALDKGDAEAALKLAEGDDAKRHPAMAAELRGDALRVLGRMDDARAAYDDALTTLDAAAPTRQIVEMKLTDLGVAPATDSGA